jgi:signal transduction histidine kinase
MTRMRSLVQKLTLAFLLIGLTGSLLVALIVRTRTQQAFDQFIFDRDQLSLVNTLLLYYQRNGSWQGLDTSIREAAGPHDNFSYDRASDRDWTQFSLADLDRTILYSYQSSRIGTSLTNREMDQVVQLVLNDQKIGLLYFPQLTRVRTPNSPEDIFLRTVNRAALASSIVAVVLALILGSLLAFTLTRPLRELKEAALQIARGKFGLQVKVRSQDELGELSHTFNTMSLDLQRATQARQQMTADIAHDLRSPLSVLTGYTEALSEGKLEGSPEVFGILHQETLQLGRLVDDLRTLSLADAGELPLVLQKISPKIILERLVARHMVTAHQKAVLLQVDARDDLPLILVDVERIAQVLDNLILNAFRYTPPAGQVTLKAGENASGVFIQVIDTGTGIDPQDLPHIFDRFYRGDKARQQGSESGLGLAIARSIVEAHQGTLTVESTPGQGATFTIQFINR